MSERDNVEPIIERVLVETLPVHLGQCSINEAKANQLAQALYPALKDRLAADVRQEDFEARVCNAIFHGGPRYEGTGEQKRPSYWAQLIYSGLENPPALVAKV